MHKIADKEFTLEDFSCEYLINEKNTTGSVLDDIFARNVLGLTISTLNASRNKYLETKDKKYWQQMIQLLPSSYNQKRTVMMSYEVLANIHKSRKNHKQDEWKEHSCTTTDTKEWENKIYLGFCDWICTLPYSELITGDFKEEK